MQLRGILLKESLKDDTPLDLVQITGTRLSRTSETKPPKWWTEVRFEADAKQAGKIAQSFNAVLNPGWYLHMWTDEQIVVVFKGRVFEYRRGDTVARDDAIAYGLSAGVPKHQLDWEDYLE